MDLTEKLLNVRRATRLLASYNRRIIGIASLINQTLEGTDRLSLKFTRWDPIFHDAIGKQTTSPFGKWGWEFLPLSYSWFSWTSQGKDYPTGPGTALVALRHDVDDAYEESDEEVEPDPASFGPAEDHRTTISLWIIAFTSGRTEDKWAQFQELADNLDAADSSDGAMKDLPLGILTKTPPGAVVRYIGWDINLEKVESEQDIENLVLRPLRQNLVAIFQAQ